MRRVTTSRAPLPRLSGARAWARAVWKWTTSKSGARRRRTSAARTSKWFATPSGTTRAPAAAAARASGPPGCAATVESWPRTASSRTRPTTWTSPPPQARSGSTCSTRMLRPHPRQRRSSRRSRAPAGCQIVLPEPREDRERHPHGDRDLRVSEGVLREPPHEKADHPRPGAGGRRPRLAVTRALDGLDAAPEHRRIDEAEGREAGQARLGRHLQEVVVRVRAPVGGRIRRVVRRRRRPVAAEAEPQDRPRMHDVEVRPVDADAPPG